MNEAIIANHNAVVKPQDEFYHLGDLAFMPSRIAGEILRQLHGKKFIILGNHDTPLRKAGALAGYCEWVKDIHELKIQKARENARRTEKEKEAERYDLLMHDFLVR